MLFRMWLLGKKQRGKSPSLKRWMGAGRVIAYGAVVSLGLGVITFHNAYANVQDQGLNVGRDLADVADLLQNVTAVRINNQPIYVGNATTTESTKTVLDRFEAHCNQDPAFKSLEWKDLSNIQGRSLVPPKSGISSLGVMRKEDPAHGDGMVMCFTRDGKAASFMDAMRTFGKTGDIGDIGNLRYVHVSTSRKGHTLVQTVWTDGAFNLRDVVAENGGDAPGSDPALLPRPQHSTRRFTAEAIGAPYAARIYNTSDAPEVALKAYDAEMDKRGWLIIDSPVRDQDAQLGHWYAHDGFQAMVTLHRDGDKTEMVVGQLGVSDPPPKSTVTQ